MTALLRERVEFTRDEVRFMEKSYLTEPWSKILDRLSGHTVNSIRGKASALNLRRRKTDKKSQHTIVEELRIERERSCYSRRALAEKMGYSETSLFRWETGRRSPTMQQIKDWCDSLSVTLTFTHRENAMTDRRIVTAVELATKKIKVLDEKAEGEPEVSNVNAGGIDGRWQSEALYLNEDQAILAYENTLRDFLKHKKASTIRFTKGPVIDRWHITVADSAMTHRAAEQRFTVTSTIEIYD